MPDQNGPRFEFLVQKNSKDDGGYMELNEDGIDPKTGEKMIRAKLTACQYPQYVWYSPKSRVALPMAKAEEL